MGEKIKIQESKHSISVDILKFIAVLFITNSHMNYAYGDYSYFATGGAIGDVLFFFCSGYTLLLGRTGTFDTWYKRRVRRIYPSILGWALISALFFSIETSMDDVILYGGGWFVTCIMIYYVILFFVRRYAMRKLKWVFAMVCVVVVLWYIFLFKEKWYIHMYKQSFHDGNDYFRWCHYFLFMLLGAMFGSRYIEFRKEKTLNVISVWLLSFFGYFGFLALGGKCMIISQLQILSLLPLMTLTIYTYRFCCLSWVHDFFSYKWLYNIMIVIGGLCLEIYLVQMPMLIGGTLPFGVSRDSLQWLFPLNVPILLLIIVSIAYVTRCLGRVFLQTFDSVDGYNWRKVVSIRA